MVQFFFAVNHVLSSLSVKWKVNGAVVMFKRDTLRLEEYLRQIKVMLPHGTAEKCWKSRVSCWFGNILHVML